MKEFILLIQILFSFPNGETQTISIEKGMASEQDCQIEIDKQGDVAINFFGMTIDLFFECVKSDEILEGDKYNYDYEIDKTLLKQLLKKKGVEI